MDCLVPRRAPLQQLLSSAQRPEHVRDTLAALTMACGLNLIVQATFLCYLTQPPPRMLKYFGRGASLCIASLKLLVIQPAVAVFSVRLWSLLGYSTLPADTSRKVVSMWMECSGWTCPFIFVIGTWHALAASVISWYLVVRWAHSILLSSAVDPSLHALAWHDLLTAEEAARAGGRYKSLRPSLFGVILVSGAVACLTAAVVSIKAQAEQE